VIIRLILLNENCDFKTYVHILFHLLKERKLMGSNFQFHGYTCCWWGHEGNIIESSITWLLFPTLSKTLTIACYISYYTLFLEVCVFVLAGNPLSLIHIFFLVVIYTFGSYLSSLTKLLGHAYMVAIDSICVLWPKECIILWGSVL
jgi:hypothetical protein